MELVGLKGAQLLALVVFAAYFLSIIGLFLLIMTSLSWKARGWRVYMFGALSAASYTHTWYCERCVTILGQVFNPSSMQICSDSWRLVCSYPFYLRKIDIVCSGA